MLLLLLSSFCACFIVSLHGFHIIIETMGALAIIFPNSNIFQWKKCSLFLELILKVRASDFLKSLRRLIDLGQLSMASNSLVCQTFNAPLLKLLNFVSFSTFLKGII